MAFWKSKNSGKITRVLYGSDFHGSDLVFRKFIAASFQYDASVLIVGGDVTGKAMVPIMNHDGQKYTSSLFGNDMTASDSPGLEKMKRDISSVGFYPIVLTRDEADHLEKNHDAMSARFEQEMKERIRRWMQLAQEKLTPAGKTLYFMAGNDDLFSIDEVVAEFPDIKDPDLRRFEIEGGYQIVGLSYANMTPWRCVRDLEEENLTKKLDEVKALIQNPDNTIAVLHVPPFNSGLDTCPELDKNLKIITQGGQVVMKSAGSPAVKTFIETVQPMLSLHGHIHESPGHVRIGKTLAINAGSEYAEGILKAAIINLADGTVKGHMLISG